jgi:GntR family transcriptional regulator
MADEVGLAKSEQVARTLEREIRAGQLSNGDLIDSEAGLMRRFSVSRNTVRRGLEMLSRQGLITTRTGIGSFVTYDGATIDSAQGWTVALAQDGGAVETRLLGINAGSSQRADQRLGAGGHYLRIDRLRFCRKAGQGISLERSRLPWREGFARVPDSGLKGGSLNATLAELGLVAASGEEIAGVIPALSVVDAGIMQRPAGVPMLGLERVTRDANGEVLEYVESILDPARFGLRIAF